MAKVTYIRLPEPGSGQLRGVGGNRNREFKLGTPCTSDWGGGVIESMVEDLSRMAIVVRKSTPFVGPMEANGKREKFSAVCVPFANTSIWTIEEEEPTKVEPKPESKPEDPPPAKPAQQQGQQRR